jgi:serine/threonine-protein kinase PknG
VVLKGLLNSGDLDAFKAAVSEKQFLAEVEHPLIVEIYNFVTAADGTSYIVMEYVGGTSLNNLVKQRTASNNGTYAPVPPDQAIAYLIEVLPAFSYLHNLGLLYCDFKPANIIQVGDGVKLIDLGGVRRAEDNDSAIYGTVGFQAPEVADRGPSVASDIYTIARTLAVLVFEFRRSTSEYVDRLPTPDQVPVFAEHDSLYRLLLKGTATAPEDRFQTAEELREQLLGVLREITSLEDGDHRSTPSMYFETLSIASDGFEWSDIPKLRADSADPMAPWLEGVTADDSTRLLELLDSAPEQSPAVRLARATAALASGDIERSRTECDAVLRDDPWDWRAVWVSGIAALRTGDLPAAVAAFNAVYGQVPGELAPKLALARACELSGEVEVAGRLYSVCARTDGTYAAPAQFGLARLAGVDGRRNDALVALGRVPAVSRAYGAARRQRAQILAGDNAASPAALAQAIDEARSAGLAHDELVAIEVGVYTAALAQVVEHGPRADLSIGGVAMRESELRVALEHGHRAAARLTNDRDARVRLVDDANRVRPRTLR